MKIFNWVQKRFHHKEGLARNVKKAESITNEADKQALLKQVALVDVLDGWKDGILTIGTLGLDPLRPFNQQNQYFVLESEEEEDSDYNEDDEEKNEQYSISSDDDDDSNANEEEEEEEEENPLIFTRFEHNPEDIGSTFDANAIKADIDAMENKSFVHQNDLQRKRITLAQLFLADSDMKKKPDPVENEIKSGKKPSLQGKNTLSFAKKLIPHVGEDSRPIKKFNQLMRRMLNRKIHPHLEAKGNKTDYQNKTSIMDFGITKGNQTVSLIQTPPGLTISATTPAPCRNTLQAQLHFVPRFNPPSNLDFGGGRGNPLQLGSKLMQLKHSQHLGLSDTNLGMLAVLNAYSTSGLNMNSDQNNPLEQQQPPSTSSGDEDPNSSQ